MSETKTDQYRVSNHGGEGRLGAPRNTTRASSAGERRLEQQGWDAYKKWLSTVSPREPNERSTVDQSIYSWKGYQDWADKVKRNWKPEDD